jgi:SIR2-like domain
MIENTRLLNEKAIPEATRALARLDWPLVLSTNYDDLFWTAAQNLNKQTRTSVLGRSLEDVHRVLRSLDETTSPILWALQGFLGGQTQKPEVIEPNQKHRQALARQIVVGHQQYQHAINADSHFRRAFAEVFRRRSLLFVGSGVLENYFENLFGEIVHHYGIGPYPHFALLNMEDRVRYDPTFLQTRLGIVPVFIDIQANELPILLTCLADRIRPAVTANAYRAVEIKPDVFGYSIGANSSTPLKFTISNTPLPTKDLPSNECLIVSVGRYGENRAVGGGQAISVLTSIMGEPLPKNYNDNWVALDEPPSFVYQYLQMCVYAVAARDQDPQTFDSRSQDSIPEAVCAVLSYINQLGNIENVHLGAVSAGPGSLGHPIHAFAQVLRGVRKFIVQENRVHAIKTITLHIVDRAVWSPVLAGKIPVLSLLSSDLSTFRVELHDTEGEVETFAVTLGTSPTVLELMNHCKLNRNDWRVTLEPRAIENEEETLPSTKLTPTMTVILSPKKKTITPKDKDSHAIRA